MSIIVKYGQPFAKVFVASEKIDYNSPTQFCRCLPAPDKKGGHCISSGQLHAGDDLPLRVLLEVVVHHLVKDFRPRRQDHRGDLQKTRPAEMNRTCPSGKRPLERTIPPRIILSGCPIDYPTLLIGLHGAPIGSAIGLFLRTIPNTPCMPYMPTLGWFEGSMGRHI